MNSGWLRILTSQPALAGESAGVREFDVGGLDADAVSSGPRLALGPVRKR